MNIDRLCPGCMNDNGGEKICSICGYDMTSQNDSSYLPVKFLLFERYIIGKVVATNTEGITYIAWDTASSSAVHIKEYFPKDISVRNPDKTVSVLSGNEFRFNEGLMDFMEINKKLIATELQAIVPVLTVFEENGTVYAVTPTVSGITLQSFLERNGGSLRWEQVRPLFLPLIDTIKDLHEIGIIHGGISPETILVGRDGKLRLMGICIPGLRKVSSEGPAELYSGYAAAEQYGKPEAALTAASDVYALSAILFRVLIGTVPPSAEARLAGDTLSVPSHFADELPRQVLVSIANGMQVSLEKRTANIDVFKNELVYGETSENLRRAANIKAAEQKATQEKSATNQPQKSSNVKYAAISAGITLGVLAVVAIILCLIFKDVLFGTAEQEIENSDFTMTEVESKGDVDPGAEESVILYEVPDFSGIYYYQITDDIDGNYDRFKITINDKKEYSDKYARGQICAQSIQKGTPVPNETEIKVTISLGPKELTVANVVGMDKQSAIIELLRQGFLYENIEVVDRYDVDSKPGVVLEQNPAYGDIITAESYVRIYVNSYEGEEVDLEENTSN